MGMYDILNNEAHDQLKLWECSGRLVDIQDEVPDVDDNSTYSVMLESGGYLNVYDNIVLSQTHCPHHYPVFDKWGRAATSKSYGENHPIKQVIEEATAQFK